jgi:cysteinyl-tRNA synthetase
MRMFVLGSHYRGPINYSDDNLKQADGALERIYTALREVTPVAGVTSAATARFAEAMNDDFNTPEALAVLLALARDLNVAKAAGQADTAAALAGELIALGQVLGILTIDADVWLKARPGQSIDTPAEDPAAAEIDALVAARKAARAAKNFAESDRIRDELLARDVILEDGPKGTTWRYR